MNVDLMTTVAYLHHTEQGQDIQLGLSTSNQRFYRLSDFSNLDINCNIGHGVINIDVPPSITCLNEDNSDRETNFFNIQGCEPCDYGKYSNEVNKNSCNDCQININGQNDTYQNIYVGQNVIADSNNGMPVKLSDNTYDGFVLKEETLDYNIIENEITNICKRIEDIDITKIVNIIPDGRYMHSNNEPPYEKCISGNTIFDNNDNKIKIRCNQIQCPNGMYYSEINENFSCQPAS